PRVSALFFALLFFFSTIPPPPSSTLFPYTTLFRSLLGRHDPRQILLMLHNQLEPAPQHCRSFLRSASAPGCLSGLRGGNGPTGRSEEHTSELQSRENLVCRLLLEKKKRISLPKKGL